MIDGLIRSTLDFDKSELKSDNVFSAELRKKQAHQRLATSRTLRVVRHLPGKIQPRNQQNRKIQSKSSL